MITKDNLFKVFKIAILILVIYIAYKLIPYMDPYIIRDWVDSNESLSSIIYILLWTILPIFLFPVPALALPGGMIFGLVEGSIYTLIGVFLNSTIMFFMTRYLAKDSVKDFLYPRLPDSVKNRLYLKNQKSLWIYFAILRFLPVISYNLINYAAGLTEMKYKHYLTSTIIGVLPGTIAYINFGDKLIEPNPKDLIIAIVIVAVVVILSLIVAKFYMPEGEESLEGKEDNNNSSDL